MNTKGIKKILFLIIILVSLSSCNKINKYKQLNEIAYSDILLQKEDRYLVYFMSNTCKACEDIKMIFFLMLTKQKQIVNYRLYITLIYQMFQKTMDLLLKMIAVMNILLVQPIILILK